MIHDFKLDYATLEYFLAATQLVLITIGMGVKLRAADFGRVLCAPRGLALVFIGQLVLTPIIAIGVDAFFSLPHGFAVGMVLIAAMPTGTLASVLICFGRGHIALAIAATGLTTLASLLTTTTVLRLFGGSQFAAGFEMPVGRTIAELSVCLLLPLAFAMWLGHVAPRRSQQAGKWCMRGCVVTVTTLVIGSFTSGRLQIGVYGWPPASALVVFAVAILVTCYLLSLLTGLPRSESFTVGMLSTLRSGNLALLLKAGLFPATRADPMGDAVLYVILFYSGASVAVSIATVLIRRATTRPFSELQRPDSAGGVLTAA
jgi:BASS family bile acid:Na+ symporter